MKPRELTVEFKRAAIARMVPGVKISALARELGAADDFASVHVSVRPGAAVSRTPSDGSASRAFTLACIVARKNLLLKPGGFHLGQGRALTRSPVRGVV